MYDQTELVLTAVIDDFQLPPSTPISKKKWGKFWQNYY